MPINLFARKTGDEWYEIVARRGSEISEIALKFLSWNLMLAAVKYAETRLESRGLSIASGFIQLLLSMYLYFQISRIDMKASIGKVDVKYPQLLFYTIMVFNLIIMGALMWGGFYISNELVKAIVSLQLQK